MANEAEEFKAIYLRYQRMIHKVAYDYVQDFYTAQDICQETFLRLHYYFDSMEKEKIYSWLSVVAANLAKDVLKKGGKYTQVVGLPEVEEPGSSEADDEIERHLRRIVARDLFVSAMTHLREKNPVWYDMVLLVKCMKVPRKEVAKEYGIAVTTVDGYLKRAENWLVAHFGEEYRNL